ncbi:PTS sugar transporter subunit IIB [Enterococcus cecorum]|uniref:PTS sugar transporter subunit IIB n=1 Tax=Enterococcus cecorum TaxID=44008 RepID=UPI001F987799|nr:PTS sugar transporter subunit IIB [Enterococcus cecorum]CAI3330265.1 PTS sugar transporter subunit IIB [Enterococcus cecorum]CAI3409562.1 PTS sugar transporter subunit IIB [Enterococcus cecorum]CAI3460212.1 PTS sugar transporter subunit IIB [Enterococcus cecorum]HJD14675.1 PTS sugar transporter subunit IIB [Candidatus Enterococcus stercoripullorum]
MKIITVCGMGVGTSLMLKMTVESVMNTLGRQASVEHWDMGTVKGKECDLIVTSEEFRSNFADQDNVVFVHNIMDANEVQTKLSAYFDEKGV